MTDLQVEDLMNSGVHIGHQTKRWNPKMKKYIYTSLNGFHIIDLEKTIPLLNDAIEFLSNQKGKILFVGTKKQIRDLVKDKALELGDYYVNQRWAGGMLTNFKTVASSLKKMENIEKMISEKDESKTKLELLLASRKLAKLEKLYGGVRGMNTNPSALFVIDVKHEKVAINEARKTGIPIVALVDTNSDPSLVDFPIPANDDAINSVEIMLNYIVGKLKSLPDTNKDVVVKKVSKKVSKPKKVKA